MKWGKKFRSFGALLLSMTVLFSMLLPETAVAETRSTAAPAPYRGGSNAEKKLTFPVHIIHKPGADNENFVIVIMGDGYTADRQEKFVEDATEKAQNMLTWSPYKDYSDRINIYAVQVVSNESGIGLAYAEENPDTYFNVQVFGKAALFGPGGTDKARALQTELEENYLDAGGRIGTIHILSNVNGNYGASTGAMFSFSQSGSTETSMTHEIAHSIGRLKDEYGAVEGPNVSKNGSANSVPWKKVLGFHRIGITAAGASNVYAPAYTCMMRELGQPFCEVCKMELIRRLNSADYVSSPVDLYIADPEVTKEHNPTVVKFDPKLYTVTEKNITTANDNENDLEFRTMVQNMENRERHLKSSFRILTADGKVRREAEKSVTIPALTSSSDSDAARVSLSVVIPWDYENPYKQGDTIDAKIIDEDTGEVLATDKTQNRAWSRVTLQYHLKKDDGTEIPIAEAADATVYVPKGSTYTLRNPKLHGYTLVGSSETQDAVKITEDSKTIIYYYKEARKSPDKPNQNKTTTVKKTFKKNIRKKIFRKRQLNLHYYLKMEENNGNKQTS